MKQPVVFGSAGVGGFAGQIYSLLLRGGVGEEAPVRLHAACEPDQVTHAAAIEALRGQGVKVLSTYDALLREPIEAVWLPVPIQLHRRFTEQALSAGKIVVCEKPAAGCIEDVDAMLAARDGTGGKVIVGFNHLYLRSTRDLKLRLLEGEIGTIQRVSVLGCWPRDSSYFSRAGWVGGLQRDGVWVLDSPANNAMAHPLHLALFLMGNSLQTSAEIVTVQAELYRVNPIENYDTCGIRVTTREGATLLAVMTHACQRTIGPRIVLYGDRGTATWSYGGRDLIVSDGVEREYRLPEGEDNQILPWISNWARGTPDDGLVGTLENARAHAVVVSAASQIAPVNSIGSEFVAVDASGTAAALRRVVGIEELFERCAAEDRLPSEMGGVGWAVGARSMDVRGYTRFLGPAVL